MFESLEHNFLSRRASETAVRWMRFNLLLFYHQMAPHDCRMLAGSLLGFLATRAASPLVTVRVFNNMFSRLTDLDGEQSRGLCMSFDSACIWRVHFFHAQGSQKIQQVITVTLLHTCYYHILSACSSRTHGRCGLLILFHSISVDLLWQCTRCTDLWCHQTVFFLIDSVCWIL